MNTVFADADYWIALLHPYDQLHDRALDVSKGLGRATIITSEMVLTEVLNYFSKRGPELRQVSVEFVKALRNNHNVRMVGQTSALFEDAFDLYAHRPDKQWSHTDCASMLLMQRAGIAEVLSYDRHFFQAGFIPLLREAA